MKTVNGRFVKEHLPEIPADANKYTRGYLLLIAGSYGMAGAAVMAARAALRTGVGYLNLAVPASIYGIVSQAVPEAVFTVYDETDPKDIEEKLIPPMKRASAVAFGSGTGALREMLFRIVSENCEKPLLLDADGLNALSEAEPVSLRAAELVLTPHAGEMARLLKCTSEDVERDRTAAVLAASARYHAVTLLKGPETLIAGGDQILVNTTGNAGMARAGSGDVLTGIIGALMAQGESGFAAAASGAWIHGHAGDLCREEYGIRSMLPTDMIEKIEEVYLEL